MKELGELFYEGSFELEVCHRNDDNGTNSGSAYIFTRTSDGSWAESSKLFASDADEGDKFGTSVAISGDTAIVGASSNDDNGSNSGAAYIYSVKQDLDTSVDMAAIIIYLLN